MIDTAQAVLLLVVVVLTILLVVLGTQVFFVLKEFRRTLNKANKVLEDADVVIEGVTGPITAISTLTAGLKAGTLVSTLLKKRKQLMDKMFEEDEDGGE